MKLPRELGHPRKGLIDIQNIDDNECFKWRIVRYLNPANNHSARIAEGEKGFAKKTYFKDMKFPVKIRDNCKIEKRIPSALVFLAMKIKKNIQSMYRKNVVKKNMLIYH